jgi:hypothetical protein
MRSGASHLATDPAIRHGPVNGDGKSSAVRCSAAHAAPPKLMRLPDAKHRCL